MPKSKKDVSKEINSNKEIGKQFSEGDKDKDYKETRGLSGRLSGLGESDDKK